VDGAVVEEALLDAIGFKKLQIFCYLLAYAPG
jgi:hypothetical protein